MACCGGVTSQMAEQMVRGPRGAGAARGDFGLAASDLGDGRKSIDLLVPGMHCAGCIARIERALTAEPDVVEARVNMSSRRVRVVWREDGAGARLDADAIARIIEGEGYAVQPFDAGSLDGSEARRRGRELLAALAIAGFAAANIMLLSLSVWSGALGATRDLFHWFSALIAIPAIALAGRPFFGSAARALGSGRVNMDVPISLAVILAAALSLYETAIGGGEAYFDAAVTLLFFLLIGRYLDHLMRDRARSAVARLLSMMPANATLIMPDGGRTLRPIADIRPGMIIAVAAGERVPVDGEIRAGRSDIDVSLVTGEARPEVVAEGARVHAGTMNLTGPLEINVTAAAENSFLAEVLALMETGEQGRAGFVRLADRAARIYVPVVHALAAATFLGWLWASGGDWHAALFSAIAVLIITCPCALGLAVPVVQIVASGELFGRGVMVKDGTALERLAGVDTVVFDKTGTLTLGRPRLERGDAIDRERLALAAGLAQSSRHPLSQALVELARERGVNPVPVGDIVEQPGAGLAGMTAGSEIRIGSRAWCGADREGFAAGVSGSELCIRIGAGAPLVLRFKDAVRADAHTVVAGLSARGFRVLMLSGDHPESVAAVARVVGIDHFEAGMHPAEKKRVIARLQREGGRVLMVGDGINDAPALAAGDASMAPAAAADIGRAAAGFVFLGDRLAPVLDALDIARAADRLVRQNFALAIAYNMVAVPLAVCGLATPLVAAIAMSSSSMIVTANALRLRLRRRADRAGRPVRGRTGAKGPLARLGGSPA